MAKKGAFGSITIGAAPAIIGEVRNVSFPQSANEIDVTVMGSGNAAFLPGSIRAGFEVQSFLEDGDAGQDFVFTNLGSDTAHATVWYPEGNSSGKPTWTGSCYIMGADMDSAADGAIELTMTLTSDGTPFTKGVVP